jgi:hypothetical protein
VQNGSFHARHELYDACLADILNELVDDGVAQFAVGHLPAAEAEAGLDLVSIDKEANRLILFGLVIMLVDGDRELDLFDDDDFLLLFRSPVALFLLVEVAAVVLYAADRRNRVGRDLYQIEAAFTGNFERLKRRQDAKLFAVFVDDANLARTNFFVDADKRLCGTFVECDGAPPKVADARLRCRPESPRTLERTLSIALAWVCWARGSERVDSIAVEYRAEPKH